MDIVDISETQYEEMKRLEKSIEQTRKVTNQLFVLVVGLLVIGVTLALYLLHRQLTQIHIA